MSLVLRTVTTAVFLTLLASVGGMTLACANSLAHDIFAARAQMSPRRGDGASRAGRALAVGVPVIVLATLAQHRSLQPLATLSFCLGRLGHRPRLWSTASSGAASHAAGLLCTLIGAHSAVLRR